MYEVGVGNFLMNLIIVITFILSFLVLMILIWWRIFKKAGYEPALSLLMIVPIVNIVMLFVIAFGKWPIYEKLTSSMNQDKTVK